MTASDHQKRDLAELIPARRRSPLNNIKFFVFCHGLLQLGHLLLSGYLKGSVSTIERRYGFSSRTSGLLVAFNEVGNTVLIVFVSFFGSRVHRPRFIGGGGIIAGVAGIMMAMPHFLSGPYEYSNSIVNALNSSLCLTESPRTEALHQDCTENQRDDNRAVMVVMFLGQLLLGIGCVPIQPFGISYIDDFASKRNSPMYLGIVFAITTMGPAAGFILGSFMLRFYVDIDKPGRGVRLTNQDPRWVGAWWLGFLVAAAFLFLTSIPYFFFPREMPKEDAAGADMEVETKNKEEKPKSDPLQDLTLVQFLRSFPLIVLRTLRNPIFLLVVLAQVNLAAVAAGVATFMSKFIEKQFTKSTSYSNMVIGGVNIPAATLGILLGGAVMKRRGLSVKAMARMCATAVLLGILFAVPLLFLGCPTQSIAGVYAPSHRPPGPLGCGLKCACEAEAFDPVCGADGVEYRSPCHAGCTVINLYGKDLNYTACSCVGASNGSQDYAAPGTCSTRCSHLFIPFIIMSTLTCFFLPFSQTPSFMMVLRTVKPEDKSFAVGVQYMLFRVLAFLPAPVIYGSAIDSACILWGKKCKKDTACLYYNLDWFRQRYLGLQAFFLCGAFVCFLLSYLVLRRLHTQQQPGLLNGKDAKANANGDANASKLLLIERKEIVSVV